MSIADEPDMSPSTFWFRVMELDTGPAPERAEIVAVPGAPLVLTLSDGRQFIGSSMREIVTELEKA